MADIIRRAELSSDRVYRYSLSRIWEPTKHPLAFIGLNPSTADETEDDPTIRRCMGFARDGGYGGVLMLNLFAFRSTKPKGLLDAEDPVGPRNDAVLLRATDGLPVVVCAWGTNGVLLGRDYIVRQLLASRDNLHYLRLTNSGHPGHPLYLPRELKPVPWRDA